MKRKIITGISMAVLSFSLFGCDMKSELKQEGNEVNQIQIKEIYNDDVYEFIDPDTGVHYWIYSHSPGMGGMTPRLNSDGSIMVD